MSTFKGKVAAVTGAGSGIGRALALELAARGARGLILADIDAAAAEDTAQRVQGAGAEAEAYRLDVGDGAAFAAMASAAKARFGVVHQLYNNAGIAQGGRSLLQLSREEIARVLDVNLWGVIHGSQTFLPLLIASGDGHLVNISSLNGLMAQAECSIYCASKFAVRGFTEALRAEMLLQRAPVAVVVVHPGGVRTNIAAAAHSAALAGPAAIDPDIRAREQKRVRIYEETLFRMTAEQAAIDLLDGIERGRNRILLTRQTKWIDRLVRAMPEHYLPRVVAWQRKLFT
jgi:NAD(P)-dependent dehydrogenase (short-subunit alcohol dehydrogenase family)